MNGAFATKSPSGPNSAHEKSRRSLILVLMEVCWRLRPIASATLMKRFAKSVNKIGSGLFGSPMVAVAREGACDLPHRLRSRAPVVPTIATHFWRLRHYTVLISIDRFPLVFHRIRPQYIVYILVSLKLDTSALWYRVTRMPPENGPTTWFFRSI